MATLPTMAQWTDAFAKLTVIPFLGELYANSAPILRAFGLPLAVDKGMVRINWSYGAGAGSIQTGAGAQTAAAVNPAWVSGTFNLDFAAVASMAYTDVGIDIMGGGFEAEKSMGSAVASIYGESVRQILGSADGNDFEYWGVENFFDEAMVIAAGMVREIPTLSGTARLLDEIDTAVATLPETGYNICITTTKGYTNLTKQIRDLGGTTPAHTALKDFGYDQLLYEGCVFFTSRHASGDDDSTTYVFFNIGDEGCQLVAPGLTDPWIVKGPKSAQGYFNEVWDVALALQLVYLSPRAAYKLQIGTQNP